MEYFAVDEITTDGKMLRLFVGEREEAERLVTQKVCDDFGFHGDVETPGTWEAPFYRMTWISEETAKEILDCIDFDDAGRLYSMSEAAEKLGMRRQSMHSLIQRGRIHAELIQGEWKITGAALRMFSPIKPGARHK